MLNPNAQKWVAALRSGEFKQAKNRLYDKGGYCCLGVACVLAEENKVKINSDWEKAANLPDEVRDWLGLKTTPGKYFLSDFLTNDNDVKSYNFQQIADIIESEPEGLFK